MKAYVFVIHPRPRGLSVRIQGPIVGGIVLRVLLEARHMEDSQKRNRG